MNSIWTSLLFLHGHVLHQDLAWRPDAQATRVERKPVARIHPAVLACCASVWPRLVGPR